MSRVYAALVLLAHRALHPHFVSHAEHAFHAFHFATAFYS